jgi:predicted alpha/beta-hydrolase family hydrolase
VTGEVDTPLGPARLHIGEPDGAPAGTLVLGGGAGGSVLTAPDLVAVAAAVRDAGWRVLRVEQPWRVAGRRIAPAPARLDTGWTAVLAHARAHGLLAGPLVLGGRSAGARVACRTAAAEGAAGVLALAFPLHPPGRPERSRVVELAAVGVPLLVVQGRTDAMGTPDEVRTAAPHARVAAVRGDHSLKQDAVAAAAVVLPWLRGPAVSGGGASGRPA